MNLLFKSVLVTLILIPIVTFSQENKESKTESEIVKEVVLDAYINGAFNELDADAMKNGFHEDFDMMWVKNDSLVKYSLSDWITQVNRRKASDYDPKDPKNVRECTFVNIDITGGVAAVKIELRNQGRLIYTDYLTLLKFESGWEIVSKVFNYHKKE